MFQLLKFSSEVEKELKSQVVQAKQVKPGHYGLYAFIMVNC